MRVSAASCRGAACCAPAWQDLSCKHEWQRDGFERVSSLGGRSLPAQSGFSSDIKHPGPWASAPEETFLCRAEGIQ